MQQKVVCARQIIKLNSMKSKFILFGCLILAFSTLSISCKKNNQKDATLNELYKLYKDGKIEECKYNGKTVFSGSINAFDAGSTIYDLKGDIIGNCNYAWGGVDAICNQLNSCQTVYCIKDNIWGQPAKNKYHLK